MTAPKFTLHAAWTPDGNRRVLECTCGAQMSPEGALGHLVRDHPGEGEYAWAEND